MTQTFNIRESRLDDLPSILQIYNAVIEEGSFTADLKSYTLEEKREWFLSLQSTQNIFTLTTDSIIVGYFYFSPWRSGRQALDKVAEISFYISREYRGQGLGKTIMTEALVLAEKKGLKYLLAILLDTNKASIGLLKKFSFEICGHLPEIARLTNRTCGQYIMLKKLS